MHRDLLRKIRVDLHGSSRSPAPAVATPTTKLLPAPIGSIALGSLFLMLLTRALTGQQIIPRRNRVSGAPADLSDWCGRLRFRLRLQ
jgi:hypothetical protein